MTEEMTEEEIRRKWIAIGEMLIVEGRKIADWFQDHQRNPPPVN